LVREQIAEVSGRVTLEVAECREEAYLYAVLLHPVRAYSRSG
jgi:hypothetical protein